MALPATFGEALLAARGRIDSVDAKVLLREACGCSAAALIGFPERELSTEAAQLYADWLNRREAGEPVAHLVGHREFYGRSFRVTSDTLIPRPDTELLVELALGFLSVHEPLSGLVATLPPEGNEQQATGADDELVRRSAVPSPSGRGWPEAGRGESAAPRHAPIHVLDLGTGTGAIAISIALECPYANVTALDASTAALEVAQDNAETLAASMRFLHGNWFEPIADERFDLIVSNPPYIAANDVHLGQGDVRFEPLSALVAGSDGLDDIRHIVAAAAAHLNGGAWLLLEHGYDQASRVCALLTASGFVEVQSWKDLAGVERVSGGRLDY